MEKAQYRMNTMPISCINFHLMHASMYHRLWGSHWNDYPTIQSITSYLIFYPEDLRLTTTKTIQKPSIPKEMHPKTPNLDFSPARNQTFRPHNGPWGPHWAGWYFTFLAPVFQLFQMLRKHFLWRRCASVRCIRELWWDGPCLEKPPLHRMRSLFCRSLFCKCYQGS